MLAMVDIVEIVHEKNDFIHIDYILPHFPKPGNEETNELLVNDYI